MLSTEKLQCLQVCSESSVREAFIYKNCRNWIDLGC